MKEKHVVLRSLLPSTRDPFLGARPLPTAGPSALDPVGLKVEVEDIDRSAVPSLTAHADVVAVAPAMPMKLIAPLGAEDVAAAPAAVEATWGVKAVKADSSPFSGNGIVVAVLDTGIDPGHPAFAGVELVRRNFTSEGDDDQHGHGTHCAGTIFGRTVDNTRIGVAPGVKKALIGKVLGAGGGASDRIVSAIQWAIDNGAQVISMSLGIDFPGYQAELQAQGLPAELATTRALEGYRQNVQLFERLAAMVRALGAFTQPTLIIAAAGNESQREVNPNFEIAVSPPAVADGVLSVAALGQAAGGLKVAPFSNTGANAAGPGVAVISARRGGGLRSMNGTSMATPHVAGLAALWGEKLAGMGQLNAGLWTVRLIASATTSGLQAGFDPFDVGAGLLQAPQA